MVDTSVVAMLGSVWGLFAKPSARFANASHISFCDHASQDTHKKTLNTLTPCPDVRRCILNVSDTSTDAVEIPGADANFSSQTHRKPLGTVTGPEL